MLNPKIKQWLAVVAGCLVGFFIVLLVLSSLSFGATYWNGHEPLQSQLLQSHIKQVGEAMGVRNSQIHKLVFETAAVESDLGHWKADEKYSGSYYGTYQLGIKTAKAALAWLKENDRQAWHFVNGLMDNRMSLKENLKKNLSYSTALTFGYYLATGVRDRELSSVRQRARVWKRYYNTYAGKGTVTAYLNKVKRHS